MTGLQDGVCCDTAIGIKEWDLVSVVKSGIERAKESAGMIEARRLKKRFALKSNAKKNIIHTCIRISILLNF